MHRVEHATTYAVHDPMMSSEAKKKVVSLNKVCNLLIYEPVTRYVRQERYEYRKGPINGKSKNI